MKRIWANELKTKHSKSKSFKHLSKDAAKSLDIRMKHIFISLPVDSPPCVEIQSLLIAIWSNINMQYALNYLLMDEYCTGIDLFALSIMLKLLSASYGEYYFPIIKAIWKVILTNDAISDMLLTKSKENKNIISYSLHSILFHVDDLKTAMKLLNATRDTPQTLTWATCERAVKKLIRCDQKRKYGWAISIIWIKSAHYLYYPIIQETRGDGYIQMMALACDFYGLSRLKNEITNIRPINAVYIKPKSRRSKSCCNFYQRWKMYEQKKSDSFQ